MSFVARPTIPAPKASYVEGLRAKEREGKKTTARAAAAAAPQRPFKTALVLNGGGLLPVASAYGIFRGLHKVCVGPNGDKPALDEFDVMAGVSGGYLASQTYCYANPEPTGFNNFDKPCPKLDPVNFLNTSANSDPNSITWDDLLTDNSKACGDKPETGYYNWMVRRQGGLNPGVISGAIMSLPFGFVARILSFGKCVGRGCWPNYGWLCLPSFSIGFASYARMFFFNFFLSPLGISQNKYTASGPDQVSDVACLADVDECEVAYPRPGAPTPMAHTQMIQVTGVGYRNFLGPLACWAREVSTFVYHPKDDEEETVEEAKKNAERKGMGIGIYKALQLQPNYHNVSVVPYTFTPGMAITQYDPKNVSDPSKDNGPMTFDRNLGTCCVDPPNVKFLSNSQPSSTWVEKPSCIPCAPITSSGHLSPEAIMSLTADFVTQFQPEDAPSGLVGSLFTCISPLYPAADITYEFKPMPTDFVGPLSEPTRCFFSDGGVLESTGLAGTIAQGVSKAASALPAVSRSHMLLLTPLLPLPQAAVMINNYGHGPWKKDDAACCEPLRGQRASGAPWTWTFDPYADKPEPGSAYMGSSLASCFGVQPTPFQPNALRKGKAVRPLYVLNHILDNNPEHYQGECSYPDLTKDKDWPGGDKVPCDYTQCKKLSVFTRCQRAGQPLVCTLKGLKVLNNPFWGTTTAQDDAIDVRKSLLKHPKACPPKLAIANCKMASYHDHYSGKDPFGCLGNFPYYGAIPKGVGGWVNDVLGNVGVPGLNALAGWTKEEVALFGYLGDYIVNGDNGSRQANFTCLLE
ncbi:hypothetical protein EMIHUDRAFT_464034 [Emiliania huxleyi CCMP1516]|uniref:PNPLA domain-containing protein n=2 Tax=Emiliania huxleyi TaxID=2903 RepID=A0A0D3J7Q3_EMIH1|nr:hypothetical protein EMIHUDRAFT_464034 [Emiliania huxleyi CCMP1516]EOD19538.1 hypothetical protein EMIHUDRAFT_464034 [Emiliania huxleyi CCMP1516]|eukprot:XP_005771967.1 hypothetical protein EMIHUDRAFT_464034 [Emiliania huxleyi CCMP1516]